MVRNDLDGWHSHDARVPEPARPSRCAGHHRAGHRPHRVRTRGALAHARHREPDRHLRGRRRRPMCRSSTPHSSCSPEVPAADALGGGWSRTLHPDDVESLRVQKQCAVDGVETRPSVVRLTTSTGVLRWVSARWVALRRGDGAVTGFLGSLRRRHRAAPARRAPRVRRDPRPSDRPRQPRAARRGAQRRARGARAAVRVASRCSSSTSTASSA